MSWTAPTGRDRRGPVPGGRSGGRRVFALRRVRTASRRQSPGPPSRSVSGPYDFISPWNAPRVNMIQAPNEEKAALLASPSSYDGEASALGLGSRHFLDLGPPLVLPAGIAGDGKNDLAVLGEDEAWRRIGARLALVAVQESRPDPQRIGGAGLFLQSQRAVGRRRDPH